MLTKRILAAAFVATAIGVSTAPYVHALDTDIYFTDPSAGSTTIKPNVMIILDTSGSMNERIAGTTQSRIDVMKEAIKDILDELTNTNVGLMRFSNSEGAGVLYPVKDLDSTIADTGQFTVAMQNATDDAEENVSGSVNINNTVLKLHRNGSGNYTTVGVRFQDVYIPKGATITSAKIVFIGDDNAGGPVNLQITADASDNAPTYQAVANNISSRTQTTASVVWTPGTWDDTSVPETFDLASVVQEVVDRSGWASGNAMAFTFKRVGTDTGERDVRAYDTYQNNNTSFASPVATLVVTYNPIITDNQVLSRVSAGTDDAEERVSGGNMSLADTSLQLIRSGSNDQKVGLRFQNVIVPKNATITSARLEFVVSTGNSTSTSLTIRGQNSDSVATFTTASGNISSRPTTAASVAWSNIASTSDNQKLISPDLSTVVQEIVNRPGWASGNAMGIIISGSGTRNVKSYENLATAAPLLRITYAVAGATALPQKTIRQKLKELVVGMRAQGSTPIVDSLYEAALYYRGNQVDYGKERGTQTGNQARWSRVSAPNSYTAGTLNRIAGCSDNDLDASACINENINNTGGAPTYITPMTGSCQTNHIVLLTDGDATANSATDKVKIMTSADTCSDSGDNACGVTLTQYLHTTDQSILPDAQTITTHTIGYNIDNAFLANLATAGGGIYETANDAATLKDAFKSIFNKVLANPTSFVSPSLSVNAFNKLFNLNDVYFSLFSPQLATAWPGNVKKFTLCAKGQTGCTFGEVVDSTGTPAIGTDSKIKSTARSYWSSAADGPIVTSGGAGANITASASRRVFTYTGSSDSPGTPIDLTAAAHAVTTGNAALTQAMLTAVDSAERTRIINWMRGQDLEDEDNDGNTTEDRWKFSDALHSRPLTIAYGKTSSNEPIIKLVVGTNDGALRMVNTKTGEEEWAVYLPEFLDDQKTLLDNPNGSHIHGVDGTGTVYVVDNNKDGIIDPASPEFDKVYLYIGMRRGGRNLYAFDITPTAKLTSATSLTGINPKLMWRIRGGAGGTTGFTKLGQTWSQPIVANIRIKCPSGDTSCDDGNSSTADSKLKSVLLFAGGYDTAQDANIGGAWASEDTMGNAIYIVDPLTGALLWWVSASSTGADLELATMKYSIPSDLALLDSNADGAVDRIYVGDTRGQLWRIDLADQLDPAGADATARNGGTKGYVFADIGCTGGDRSNNCNATVNQDRRKFFYPPDVAQVEESLFSATTVYDLVAIGTGDREDPLDKHTKTLLPAQEAVHNRLYAFRDFNTKVGPPPGCCATPPTPLADANLYNATSNDLQDPNGAGYSGALTAIKAASGWFIDLKQSSNPQWVGEKALAKPTIFDGQLFVTTFTPTVSTTSCPEPSEGTARLATMNYLNGTAVNTSGNRWETLGGGIPSELVIVIQEGGVTRLVGTSGGASAAKIGDALPRFKTHWHQN